MSFSETRLDLGIDYGTRASLRFNTTVIVDGTGREQRNANWSQPLGRYQIGERSVSNSELDYFLAFHAERKGSFEGFRFKDWSDYQANNQLVGIGDGTSTRFQLTKTYRLGSYSVERPILKPVGDTVEIYLNGQRLISGWVVDITTGIITFTSAPDTGTVISSSFEFDVPVRFEQDKIDFRFDAYEVGTGNAIFQLQNLSLVELRLQPTIAIPQRIAPTLINEILDLGYDYGTVGGPSYNTTITNVGAEYESRTSNWEGAVGRWQIGDRTLTRDELDYLIAIHRVVQGSASGFVYKDWASNRKVSVRFLDDNIEFRFDAYDSGSSDAIFYLAGLSVIEINSSLPLEQLQQSCQSLLFNTGFGSAWSGVEHVFVAGWLPNDLNSKWLSYKADTNKDVSSSDLFWDLNYTFTFYTSVQIDGRALVDDQVDDVLVNGVAQGIVINSNYFGTWTNFTLTLIPGKNTITFKIRNYAGRNGSGNPTGCRVEWLSCKV